MTTTDQFVSTTDSPYGELTLVSTDSGIRLVKWTKDVSGKHSVEGKHVTTSEHPMLKATALQLKEYFAGERTEFDVSFDFEGTEFQRQAWLALGEIPFGTTTTYSGQANRLGRPAAVRAVGAANGRNPDLR